MLWHNVCKHSAVVAAAPAASSTAGSFAVLITYGQRTALLGIILVVVSQEQ